MRKSSVRILFQAVYIAPLKALVRERMDDWKIRFQEKLGRRYEVIKCSCVFIIFDNWMFERRTKRLECSLLLGCVTRSKNLFRMSLGLEIRTLNLVICNTVHIARS